MAPKPSSQLQEPTTMRSVFLVSLFLATFAMSGCWSLKTDGKTMATPKKKKTALFSCSAAGPCIVQVETSE